MSISGPRCSTVSLAIGRSRHRVPGRPEPKTRLDDPHPWNYVRHTAGVPTKVATPRPKAIGNQLFGQCGGDPGSYRMRSTHTHEEEDDDVARADCESAICRRNR